MRPALVLAAVAAASLVGAACSGDDDNAAPTTTSTTAAGATTSAGPATGSPATTGEAPGTHSYTLSSGGTARTYRVHYPAGLSEPTALVVMLHGGFGDGAQAERSYGWDAKADAEHFVVAYPDGLDRAWAVGGGCCGKPGRDNVDDVGFVTAMVRDIEGRGGIDDHRVFATGISNGGLLSYRLACDTTVFAAIGPDAATLLGDCPSPAPISVVHVHGLADGRIRFGGGRGEGVAHIDGPPVPDVIARWRALDGCSTPVVTSSGPVTTSASTCDAGRAVTLITVDGAGHQWPGSERNPIVERLLGLDPPSQAMNATDVIWSFFASHPKPG